MRHKNIITQTISGHEINPKQYIMTWQWLCRKWANPDRSNPTGFLYFEILEWSIIKLCRRRLLKSIVLVPLLKRTSMVLSFKISTTTIFNGENDVPPIREMVKPLFKTILYNRNQILSITRNASSRTTLFLIFFAPWASRIFNTIWRRRSLRLWFLSTPQKKTPRHLLPNWNYERNITAILPPKIFAIPIPLRKIGCRWRQGFEKGISSKGGTISFRFGRVFGRKDEEVAPVFERFVGEAGECW